MMINIDESKSSAASPQPYAPTFDQWKLLKLAHRPDKDNPVIDVVVPVYGGYDETMRCLFSVLNAPQKTPYRLLVVDDASPEGRLVDELNELNREGLIDLISLPQNQGFVGACNIGLTNAVERDVVLLNSDTEVHNDWLDRMRAVAYSDSRVATVTPFSNNAEICSYPQFVHNNCTALELDDCTLDQLASVINQGRTVTIPTGVGFCMYIRRDCLNEVGLFNLEEFGKGYGEENDLCRRAVYAGWVNLLAPNVFVRHYGGASFGANKMARIANAMQTIERLHPGYANLVQEFIALDPVKPLREALDIARMKRQSNNGSVLAILHSWGGGTEMHVADMAELIKESGMGALTGKFNPQNPRMLNIFDESCAEMPNLPEFDVMTDVEAFARHLRDVDVRHLHIHHLAGYPEETSDFLRVACEIADIDYDVTLHDYISICPRITLTDRSGVYCGEPALSDCERCIQRDGSPFGRPSVWAWRERYSRLLVNARKVFVPHDDVAARLKQYFTHINFVVRTHPEHDRKQEPKTIWPAARKNQRQAVRVIAMIGAIGPHKGSEVLEKIAIISKQMGLPLKFHVIGYTDRDAALRAIGNVHITGKYPREKAEELLVAAQADFVLFASVWPETFCYALSVAFSTNQTPVSFDIGAIGKRIKDARFGIVLPIELMTKPGHLAIRLASLDVSGDSKPLSKPMTYRNVMTDYYELDNLGLAPA